MPELSAGSTFADHLIRGVAGRGGMGIVYRALHLPLEREVALKVLAAEVSALPEYRTRFRREFRAAASIQHPNVIPIFHAGEADGRLYVTMRYVDGTDLGRMLAGGARLVPGEAVGLIAQVAAALDAAHALGIVHRDVKPANVLVAGEQAVLTDFGLMKNLLSDTQVTQTGSFIGTFDYAAPEQLREEAVDARTDVYGLGCVLYHALTGRVPYPFETAAAKMLAHLETAPPVPSDSAPELPDALDDVVARAMAKDPDDRFPSAGDLARAALAALERRPPGEERSVATGEARHAPAAPAIPLPPPLADEREPFVGREDALARLLHRYELADQGERQFVLLCGEAGIGKTRLAGELGRRVHADGATVLYGRSDPGSLVPYQPFIACLHHYVGHREGLVLPAEIEPELAELARFVPLLRRRAGALREPLAEDPETRRFRLFEAVTRVVAFVARRRPVVLVLDDLHWADTSTIRLLGHLLRDPEPVRLLVVGTARSEEGERGPELPDLLERRGREPGYERLPLGGLDAGETGALVAAREDRDVTAGFVARLRDETAGNPFFIEETLRSLADAEPGADLERALSRIRVPEGVKELISRRLARLGETTDQVLTVASAAGREFRLGLLAALLELPEDDVLAALEEAAAAGLVRETGTDVFAYSHALVREALYERLSASRRARLHLRIGEALEAAGGADPAELAHHFFESRELDGAERAFGYALAAASDAAVALAYEEAAEHYRRALATAPEDRKGEVLLGLGHAEERAGDPAARATFARAAELARAAGEREALAEAALGFAGRYAEAGVVDREGIALLEEALAGLAGEESPLVVRLLARLADDLQFAGADQTEALSLQALELARRIGDPAALVAALESRHAALLHIDHLDERLELSAELLELAGGAGERELAALGHHWRIYDLLEAADVDAARAEHAALARLAEELRQPLYRHFAVGWEVVWAQMAGRVAEAERLAQEAYELGRRAQARDADTVHAAQLLVLRRREDRLQEYISTVDSFVSENPALVAWRAVLPLAHLVAGNREEGVAAFERFARDGFAAVPRDMFWFTAMSLLAETCALLRDIDRARVLYEALEPYRERMVQVTQAACLGSTERFLGLLAGALGDWDTAIAHIETAMERNAACGIRPVALRMRGELADLLLARRGPGDAEHAQELLRRTLAEAELAGMASLASRARTRIAELS